jgi:hypothetical protein
MANFAFIFASKGISQIVLPEHFTSIICIHLRRRIMSSSGMCRSGVLVGTDVWEEQSTDKNMLATASDCSTLRRINHKTNKQTNKLRGP